MTDNARFDITYKDELIDHAADALADATQVKARLDAVIEQKKTPSCIGMRSTLEMQRHTVDSLRRRAFAPDVPFRDLARLTKEFLLLEEMTATARGIAGAAETS